MALRLDARSSIVQGSSGEGRILPALRGWDSRHVLEWAWGRDCRRRQLRASLQDAQVLRLGVRDSATSKVPKKGR